ncbi:MAG: hypothetical protein HQK51_08835 [Oligoflexia bacterium]|nr:hypothetical protein [Oligoflexia bacterium]
MKNNIHIFIFSVFVFIISNMQFVICKSIMASEDHGVLTISRKSSAVKIEKKAENKTEASAESEIETAIKIIKSKINDLSKISLNSK